MLEFSVGWMYSIEALCYWKNGLPFSQSKCSQGSLYLNIIMMNSESIHVFRYLCTFQRNNPNIKRVVGTFPSENGCILALSVSLRCTGAVLAEQTKVAEVKTYLFPFFSWIFSSPKIIYIGLQLQLGWVPGTKSNTFHALEARHELEIRD